MCLALSRSERRRHWVRQSFQRHDVTGTGARRAFNHSADPSSERRMCGFRLHDVSGAQGPMGITFVRGDVVDFILRNCPRAPQRVGAYQYIVFSAQFASKSTSQKYGLQIAKTALRKPRKLDLKWPSVSSYAPNLEGSCQHRKYFSSMTSKQQVNCCTRATLL